MGDISTVSEVLLHLFAVFRVSRACQIFFLELSKDGLADNRDGFTYGDSANQISDTARMCRFLLLPGV